MEFSLLESNVFCNFKNWFSLVNGKIHWTIDPRKIFSLDLRSETCIELEQPEYGEGSFKHGLGALRGFLCMYCSYEFTHLDIWITKEYDVKEFWTKTFVIKKP